MRTVFLFVIAGLLTACAADPAKVQDVAAEEAERLAPPTRPLSEFAEFELAAMTFDDAIVQESGKMEEAQEFESNLQAKLDPLLANWNAGGSESAVGTLSIEANLVRLKIVSGGARFWAGAFAGDSFLDLDLRLVDKSSGEVISDVQVRRNADSMTGAWSVGKSDQNLDEYVVSIIHQYLSDNY
jgi:curli biogenesis system outer membrane secretion channel CsgG